MCEQEPSINIFDQPWWMDAVCGEDNWDVLIYEKGNEIWGALPYYVKKKHGFSYITQPPLTRHNGPWIRPMIGSRTEKILARDNEVMGALISQLEALPVVYYRQWFSPDITNWLPFYWRGYSQTTKYVYRLKCSDYDKLFQNFNKTIKHIIRDKGPEANIYSSFDYKKYYYIGSKSFERQGLNMPVSSELIKRLIKACRDHDAGNFYFAEDHDGNLHCGSFVVWDKNYVYQLMSGTDPKFKEHNFKTLLILQALQLANATKKDFDFQGSMMPGINEFLRKFNSMQVPHYAVSKVLSHNFFIRQAIKWMESKR